MRLRPILTLAAVTVASLALFACNADSPLADGPGPLPQRDGPLTITQGNEAFNAGDYGAALEAYALADEQMPERPEPEYNSGNALYRMDSLEEAQNLYQGALVMADDDEISKNSLFNIGNVLFTSEQYPEAIEAYKEALRIDPTDLDAKYNLELALRRLQEQEQQQQPQSGEGDSEKDQPPDGEQEQQPDEQGEEEKQEKQPGPGASPDQPPPTQSNPESEQEPQPDPVEGLTEEQARQLLQSVGENTETLQSKIQQVLVVSGPPPEQNW